MDLDKQYEVVKKKIDLVDYIYYLQYEVEKDDITVETRDAVFMVWESSTFKVNGDEFTTAEFYDMLSSRWKVATCNGETFESVGGKFTSINSIDIRTERFDSVIDI